MLLKHQSGDQNRRDFFINVFVIGPVAVRDDRFDVGGGLIGNVLNKLEKFANSGT